MLELEFIEKVAHYVRLYAPSYDIRVHSPIIAIACIESGFGKSSLSAKYNNHFGMKTGSSWKGQAVSLKTQEWVIQEYVTITDAFRVYPNFEEGVRGFFEFIQYSRYQNLKGVTSWETFITRIVADGYCTDPYYIGKVQKIIDKYSLTRYDNDEPINKTFAVGSNYTIIADALRVRRRPSIEAELIPHDELTPDGQAHDRDKNSSLEYGTIVTCLEVFTDDSSTWLRIPSGWVCANLNGEKYII